MAILFSTRHASMQTRLQQLSHLDLSNNDFDAENAKLVVSLALKGYRLKHLNLSGNSDIGDSCGIQILEMLKAKGQRLEAFRVEDAGATALTISRIEEYVRDAIAPLI
ncbi:hypothetical protein BGZ99_003668 [Dissophora globulifera]|uniref:Uncharacterized protein n=1 Tax=Dissophora globulifera TaxID=979702 RepID=A0A9P6V028_9FUNG|nr:hypothetical protein BGZ99_003668 [Dissophora globulifera]